MNDILYEFEKDKKYIEEFPLESTEGTKKMMKNYHTNAVNSRNAYVNNKIGEYSNILHTIYAEINRRVNDMIPTDTSSEYTEINRKINSLKKIIKYNNRYNDIYEKLDIDKTVNNISDNGISDFSKVNALISKVIRLFEKASIKLTASDFDYSVYSYEYMIVFFESLDKSSFNDDMKDIFDKLYWECPNLITHLKLSIRYLSSKYKKELEVYYTKDNEEVMQKCGVSLENIGETFDRLIKDMKEKMRKDSFLLSNKFFNGTLSIYDYMDGSPSSRKSFNKFLFDKEFEELDEKSKNDFNDEISSIKDVVVELKGFNKYRPIIMDIKERYKNKDSFKDVYQNKLKEINSEEVKREKLFKKYYGKESKFLIFTKKINRDALKVEINEQVKLLDRLYDELDDAKINDVIYKNLDDTSTLYDALYVCASFYSYFKKMCDKLEFNSDDVKYLKEYHSFYEFIITPTNSFITKSKLNEDTDINNVIYEKYKLLNINITMDDLTDNLLRLEDDIDFVNLVNNIKSSDISLEDIKFIVDFRRIDSN